MNAFANNFCINSEFVKCKLGAINYELLGNIFLSALFECLKYSLVNKLDSFLISLSLTETSSVGIPFDLFMWPLIRYEPINQVMRRCDKPVSARIIFDNSNGLWLGNTSLNILRLIRDCELSERTFHLKPIQPFFDWSFNVCQSNFHPIKCLKFLNQLFPTTAG